MKNKTFVIADIHGCYKTMMALIKKLPLDRQKDTVVFLGDYVDRGPRTRQVISRCMDWEKRYPHWKFLYGNHEDLMLDALIYKGKIYQSYDLWYGQGGLQTAQSYFPPGFSKYAMAISQPKDHVKWKHLDWLRNRDMYYETKDYFFVHAGINPDMSISAFKKNIDTNEQLRHETIWIRDEFINSKHNWGKKIIFGHTADYKGEYFNPKNPWKVQEFMPIVKKNKIGIDCAPCPPTKNKLCALELPAEKFYFQKHID